MAKYRSADAAVMAPSNQVERLFAGSAELTEVVLVLEKKLISVETLACL